MKTVLFLSLPAYNTHSIAERKQAATNSLHEAHTQTTVTGKLCVCATTTPLLLLLAVVVMEQQQKEPTFTRHTTCSAIKHEPLSVADCKEFAQPACEMMMMLLVMMMMLMLSLSYLLAPTLFVCCVCSRGAEEDSIRSSSSSGCS